MIPRRASFADLEAPPVIGHRGARGHAPENTLASIRKAAELGALWVEFDTKLSRDCEVIVYHDDDLRRTTDGRGPVAGKDLAELQALDAGGWYGNAFLGEPVPTLRQAMAVLAELVLGAVVEIKPSAGRETETGRLVAAILQEEWPPFLPPPLISSFSAEALAAAGDTAPGLPRAMNFLKIPADWNMRLSGLGCAALHCRARKLTPQMASSICRAGFRLRCFTVNKKARAETLFGWGVSSVFTDYPDRLLSFRSALDSRRRW
ncbi:MAG: glycerophosphodiester phosphodiesterase [Rhodospirillales bacterium]|nr:glycerophosphodiester phosphodiesterase [Rhodospirillales bacterium]HIJ43882.1 glycerophosphodiester phosphodiesterase [Rhodospirillaceae bacterium]MDP7097777.1 glycerophosphodiester phosphodiesterase [Rhodospirillales bacterium]MDP7215429.1 glycerophosphodiester phosphodiesterase [Rhodospirillales bacterium]HIJ45437.1 glycerophosphodiester phosphodiesterase [Rhodospirillaceae bacterium]